MKNKKRIRCVKVIGLGGIGTVVLPILCRMLTHHKSKARFILTLVDGDKYEPKNAARQSFRNYGWKAISKAQDLAPAFPQLSIRTVREYVTEKNIGKIISEGDTVFLCVDNHKTRKRVSDQCRTLKNIVLISGGNELMTGNSQVYIRKNNRNITQPLDEVHPEIANPEDKAPDEIGCEMAIAQGQTQLLITNAAVAIEMLKDFWDVEEETTQKRGETYVNLKNRLVQTMPRLPGRVGVKPHSDKSKKGGKRK